MRRAVLSHEADFPGWREQARILAACETPPEDVVWSVREAQQDLLSGEPLPACTDPAELRVPRAFVELAEQVVQHSDPERFAVLYRLLWRLNKGEKHLLQVATDADVHRATVMAKAVGRDSHKLKAFLRFREIETGAGPYFLAWFEPTHFVLDGTAPFFVRRFANMRWSILTPYRSAHWDLKELTFGPGAAKGDVPAEDAREEDWRVYYANIFNPARLNLAKMAGDMPKKYWRNLPEAGLIAPLAQEAVRRTQAMIEAGPTPAPERKGRVSMPQRPVAQPIETAASSIDELREQAKGCRACPLWAPATQTVFGEGPQSARIMMVGEQPGDQEDLAGRPFVGPAGQLFNDALEEAGVDRSQLYVTNAVKHFKFVPRGKRRIHSKPNTSEIQACGPWLVQEIGLVRPSLIVAMGATAGRALLGRDVTISRERSRVFPLPGNNRGMITVHPSFMLRILDHGDKAEEFRRFVADLKMAWAEAGERRAA